MTQLTTFQLFDFYVPNVFGLQPVGICPATVRSNCKALGMETTAPLLRRTFHCPSLVTETSHLSAPSSFRNSFASSSSAQSTQSVNSVIRVCGKRCSNIFIGLKKTGLGCFRERGDT